MKTVNFIFLNKIFEILRKYSSEVLFIILTGSCCFKLKNCHDMDIVAVIDSKNVYTTQFFRTDERQLVDLFIMSYDNWLQICPYAYLNFQFTKLYPENLLYGSFPDEKAFVGQTCLNEALYKQYKQGLLGPLVSEDKKTGNCAKRMYWNLISYYVYLNNGTFNFTTEQWDTIQKCHDRELHISYRDKLKANIEKVLRHENLLTR